MTHEELKGLVAQGRQGSGMPARDKRAFLYAFAMFLDLLAMVLGYVVALVIRDERWLQAGGQSILTLALPVFIMFALAREVHSAETLESRLLATQRALSALGATALVVVGLGFFIDPDEISRLGLAIAFTGAAVFMVVGKVVIDILAHRMLGPSALKTIVLCDGMDIAASDDADKVDVGAADVWPDPQRPDKIDLLSHMLAPYDRVIVACDFAKRTPWAVFLKGLDVGGEIVLDRNLLLGAVAIGNHQGHDTLVMSMGPLNLANRAQKRAFDLVVAGVAVLVLAPLFILVAIAIKIDSPGPVLFRQRRVGLGNRHFDILKFRSMRVENSDLAGNRSAARDDDRVTRVGRLIRRTSIDELPQLFNVLRGEMSIVGPRPHALGSRAGESLFWQASEYYWMRHALKPGLTGLAQIRGYRGATDTEEDLEKRVRADLEYLGDWSLSRDIMIMIKTARVLLHENAY